MKVTVILVVLASLGWAASDWLPKLLADAESVPSVPADGLFAVRRGALNVTLTESGSLVAKESRAVASEVRGGAKIMELVDEGAQVKEGDVVCRLDSSQQEEQLEQREMDILQAQADLDTARTNLEIQQTDNTASIEKAGNAVEKTTQELERYLEGDAPKERRRLLVSISEAETAQTRARKKHEDSQTLLEQEFITALQAEEDEIAWKRAEVQLESARKDLELFEKYTLPMTTKERRVAVSDAERELENSSKRAASSLRQKEVAVQQHEQRLEKLVKQRDELTEEIGKMTLTAPVPGIVIYGDPRQPWRFENIRVGEEVWGRNTIITIPDLRVMQVKLRIHEADISKIHDGLPVKVTMDTYPGLVLDGKVTKIATIASGDDRWDDDPEVRKFDIEVTLESEGLDLELKPGVSARAEVFIDKKDDVLQVPIQCVFLDEGRHLVYTLGDDGRPMSVEVTPGLSNQNWIEILDGLEQGQQVLLYNPSLGASSAPSDDSEGSGAPAAGSEPAAE